MAKKAKGKHRLDKFYHLAKEQGFRSRAAFKLIQLNRQFRFLEKARTCLDLCAAPGGWMQVASKEMPLNSFILGIDLDPIKPVKGCRSIVGDITTAKARAAIKKESNGSKIEIVLHDGAPNVGGVWTSEAYTQSALVLEALRLATDVLTPKGTFVTKIFRSQDYNALLYAFKQLFTKVEATKPAASRNTSAEIFVVCLGYRAPAKIDPRLLDPKHLFKEIEVVQNSVGPDALLKQKIKQRKFRGGYSEGLSSLFKQTSAASFIQSESPVEMLGQFTRFYLEDNDGENGLEDLEDLEEDGKRGDTKTSNEVAKFAREHPLTNTEIRTLLDDLQVLGRSEFKQLLKWRLRLRKEMDAKRRALASKLAVSQDKGQEDSDEEEDQAEKILQEMQEIKDHAEHRQKREKKKSIESKKKSRIRAAQLAMGEGIADETGPNPLFSLASIKGEVKAAELGDNAEAPDEDAAESSGEEEETEDVTDYDTDEERRRYEAEQEEAMEDAYQSYLDRQGQRAKIAAQKRARLEKPGDVLNGPTQEVNDAPNAVREPVAFQEEPESGGGLLVENTKAAQSPAELAQQWYSQDIFKDFGGLINPEDLPRNKRQKVSIEDSESGEEDISKEEDKADAASEDSFRLKTASKKSSGNVLANTKEGEFEVVPREPSDSDGSSASDIEEPNPEDAAEIRAVAKAMLKGRTKNDMIEDGYHRYAFHDVGLPRWFAEDEQKHMRPPALVSKDEIEAEKERMRAIDTRPLKKVAEAKARKKKRLQVRLEQAKSKANSIMEQGDLSERAKAKEVASLMARAKSGTKSKKKPSRNDKFKKKGPPLDRRLFSDKRQIDNKKKKAVAKARKKKGGAKNKGKR